MPLEEEQMTDEPTAAPERRGDSDLIDDYRVFAGGSRL
jgi:hypothetical protein